MGNIKKENHIRAIYDPYYRLTHNAVWIGAMAAYLLQLLRAGWPTDLEGWTYVALQATIYFCGIIQSNRGATRAAA